MIMNHGRECLPHEVKRNLEMFKAFASRVLLLLITSTKWQLTICTNTRTLLKTVHAIKTKYKIKLKKKKKKKLGLNCLTELKPKGL